MIVAAAGCGAYVVLSGSSDKSGDDSGNQTVDSLADPLIQGNMGIGSTFTYEPVSATYNGSPTTVSNFKATIVGQSGSYYMLKIDIELRYSPGSYYGTTIFEMIHKTTGVLRFASSAGTDSILYQGSQISLNKWELSTVLPGGSNTYRGAQDLIFSSSPQDAVPYKITCSSSSVYTYTDGSTSGSSFDLSVKLSSSDIKSPTPYTKSADIGKGFVYHVEGTAAEYENVSFDGTVICAAEGQGTNFALIYYNTGSGSNGGLVIGYLDYNSAISLNDPLSGYIQESYYPIVKEKSERINTIDGSVTCDVYTEVGNSANVHAWVGQTNKVVYLVDYDGMGTAKLLKYIR